MGFCDYEVFESPDNRGQYNWPETVVSSQAQSLTCVFGPVRLDDNAANAVVTRECVGNLRWMNYDGSQCATQDTDMLRQLGRVMIQYGREIRNMFMGTLCLCRKI